MKGLDKYTEEAIWGVGNGFDFEGLEDLGSYKKSCVSVFDHRLSEDEYCAQSVIGYADSFKGVEELQKYNVYEKSFLGFYLSLYNKTTVYGYFSPGYGPSAIVVFDSIEEYKSHVLLSVREQLFLKLVLPEYSAVISGNYDLTHLLYTMKSKPESLSELTEIIKTNGLFVL